MARRSLGFGSVLVGVLVAVLIAAATGAAILLGGLYPVAASSGDSAGVSAVIHEAMERSVRRGARGLTAPAAAEADIVAGAAHYKAMCQQCHGGPGAEREEFALGLNPRPPALDRGEAARWSEPQVFWIVKNGIRMTAMPAFGKTHSDEDIWRIAAFVKRLPDVGAPQYAAFPTEHEEGAEHHEHHHHD
jgi:mono/diheme cytochrome c family protein